MSVNLQEKIMYASPDHLLEDVQLSLENDKRWYRWCNTPNLAKIPQVRRSDDTHFFNAMKYFYRPAADLSMDQQAYLRAYFLWRYTTDQMSPCPQYTAGGLKIPIKVPVVPYPFKEKSMSLKFNTVHLLNGTDVTKLPKDEVYAAIEVEEQRIEKLRKIKHQPKSLIAEIEQAEATLTALVAHLDSI